MNKVLYWLGYSKVRLCLSSADSVSDKEASDMGCAHQHMKLSAQQTSGTIHDSIAHFSTITLKTLRLSRLSWVLNEQQTFPIKKKIENGYLR
ncbi:hypothetical protein AVEN_147841-1 [Araneus ventricosus]|uniref:Uncharacterized protein n=1 Tax=Araneus ventricosus TaxID=182803 RepID=A0A4Y2CR04_ARAVE|nr:hypothetical protein AVEN_147841-1 [Araneus ventricosus]